jgi:tetratricopeptide (TPR) repeat protein
MATRKLRFAPCPKDAPAFDFAGDALKQQWTAIHAGDQEPFPDAKRARALLEQAGNAAPKGVDADQLTERLQEAWRAFHIGDFSHAYQTGAALGPTGASVATKALGIHAAYLVEDAEDRIARFELAAQLAEAAVQALPDQANSHYRLAFALGRYSQGISIAKALKMGLAGRIREHLEATLELAPKHAEAHLAMAVYHAELISKVGSLVAGLTYGAKAAKAEEHIAIALKLCPKAPIVHVEHANVLNLLYGRRREAEVETVFRKAAKSNARDAMEWLDARHAQSQLP